MADQLHERRLDDVERRVEKLDERLADALTENSASNKELCRELGAFARQLVEVQVTAQEQNKHYVATFARLFAEQKATAESVEFVRRKVGPLWETRKWVLSGIAIILSLFLVSAAALVFVKP